MKSLKSFQYILIGIFVILILIVAFNLNLNNSQRNSEKNIENHKKEILKNDFKNIVYNGENDLFENGKKFASIKFQSLEEKENGIRILKNISIIHLNSNNVINCSNASIDLEGVISLLSDVILKNSDEDLIITFKPPVIFKNKTMEGAGLVTIKDLKANQYLQGIRFKYYSENKLLTTYSNSIFNDLNKNIIVKSESSYSDFNKHTILFIKSVNSYFNNKKTKLKTSVLFYRKLNNNFHFSGHSVVFENNTKLKMVNGFGFETKEGKYQFKSKNKILFDSINIIGSSKGIDVNNNLLKFKNFISTNGVYIFKSPQFNLDTKNNISFGKKFHIVSKKYLLKGLSYKIENNGNKFLVEKPIFKGLNKDFNILSELLEIKNKKILIFTENVNGIYENKKFFCDSMKILNNNYILLNSHIVEKNRELFADNLDIYENIVKGNGNIVLKEKNKEIKSDNIHLENKEAIFYGNVNAAIEGTNILAEKAFFNNSFAVFLKGKLSKGKNYFAKSNVIIWFNNNKIVCLGDALFIDKSTGKATGDSLTLNVSTDTMNLKGMKRKAKIEFKYEKKTNSK